MSFPPDFNCQLERRDAKRAETEADKEKEGAGGGGEQVTGSDKRTNAPLGSTRCNRAVGRA